MRDVSLVPQYAMSAVNPTRKISKIISDLLGCHGVGELLMEFRDRKYVQSVIAITHDLSVLAQVADTILVMYAGRLAEKADTASIVSAPRHPYTRALLASLPEVGVRYVQTRLTGIPGRPPSLANPPAGCRFAARCPLATSQCREQPPFAEIVPGHFVACWNAAAAGAVPAAPAVPAASRTPEPYAAATVQEVTK